MGFFLDSSAKSLPLNRYTMTHKMTRPLFLGTSFIFLFFISIFPSIHSVKFTLPAMPEGVQDHNRVCLSEYVAKGVLVRGDFQVTKAPSQFVSLEVFDSTTHRNQYFVKKDIDGPGKFLFTAHEHAAIFICFHNTLQAGQSPSPALIRDVTFTLKTGAEAKEDAAFEVKDEHLKPVEISLRRIQSVLTDIVDEQDYLKSREEHLRDVNESTLSRLQTFSIASMAILIGLGIWQVYYLRQFFRSKKLI